MGIYLPNMEMPKGADEHRLIIRANGQVIIDKKTYWEEAEAVPVPPHVRLGDLDALITTFCEWGTSLERKGKFVITMAEAKQTIVDIIEKATIIIPAEGGET